jgi:hypothetical protein
VTCDINGDSIADGTSPCAGDSFLYSITSADGTVQSNESEIIVRTRATTSFSQGSAAIHTTFAACQGCHRIDGIGEARWVRDADSAENTLTSIRASNPSILSGAPDQALLYRVPCAGAPHPPISLTAGQCGILLQWIREGAHLH